MADDNSDNIQATSLDYKADQKIPESAVREENYKDGVARSHVINPAASTPGNQPQSVTQAERTILSDVLRSRMGKLDKFGAGLNRRNDFRLQETTGRLTHQLRRDFAKEISTGPLSHRLRRFDIQSQATRMISANAALGTYQFQRNQTLPYMRKSLALDYTKVDLLKRIAGGITHLEHALLVKLEAVKMNSAAAAPKNLSFIQLVRNAVRAKNVDRVATNISNKLMDGYHAQYKKFVSPILSKVHQIMVDKNDKTGGINGIGRALSLQLNQYRHKTAKFRDSVDTSGSFGQVQQAGASMAASLLGLGVKAGQKFKLGSGTNRFVANRLTSWTSFLDTLDPLSRPGGHPTTPVTGPNGTKADPATLVHESPMSRLLAAFESWTQLYRRDQNLLLDHVGAIRQVISPVSLIGPMLPAAGGIPAVKAKVKTQASSFKTTVHAPNPTVSTGSRLRLPPLPKFSFSLNASNLAARARDKAATAAVLGAAALTGAASQLHGVHATGRFANWNQGPWGPRSMGDKVLDASAKAKDHVAAKTPTMIDYFKQMGDRLKSIDLGIRKEDKDRSLFEKGQIKRQTLADKLMRVSGIRKGSYEDIEAKKHTATMGPWGPWSPAALAAFGHGGIDPVAPGVPEVDHTGIPSIMGMLGMGAAWAGKGALKYGWKGAKFGAKGLRRFIPFAARTGTKGALRASRLGFRGMWSGSKLAMRGGWGATKLMGKGGLNFLKLSGKGLFSLAKGPFGIGLAAGIGNHYLQESHLGAGTKRAGGTLLEMAEYGAMGSVFGPVGTALGAALGAVIANSDYVAKGLGMVGHGIAASTGYLWRTIFGQKARFDGMGHVTRREESSLLGDLKIAFMGRDAKYSPSGELIAPARLSLVGDVKYGFQKLLFGDKFDNGEYKEGTSLVSMIGTSISKTLKSFGREIMALPGQIKNGFVSAGEGIAHGASYLKDKTVKGAKAVGHWTADKFHKTKDALSNGAHSTKSFIQNFSLKSVGQAALGLGEDAAAFSSTGFAIGASTAIFGWASSTDQYSDPASPYCGYVTQALDAYGIKDRGQYKFLHSLELSQDKINKGHAKPFDDNDMSYMASRFGFDPKNKDAINYFKLWFKRRFIPAQAMIAKVLKAYKLDVGSAFSADAKQIVIIADALKKEIGSSDLKATGLEPSVQAYNKYAKIGGQDPGKTASAMGTQAKPFDPRDPRNQNNPNNPNSPNYSSPFAAEQAMFGKPGVIPGMSPQQQAAQRVSAQMAKGKVTDQPEFKSAYQKLPPNVKKVIDKSPSLQFTLWSTSVQHGPDVASQIFQRDYSDNAKDSDYIKSIYQDRSTRFGDVSSSDRADAVQHLGQEEQFALGIDNGSNKADINAMGREISNVVSPAGNSNQPGMGLGNYKPVAVTGSEADRTKDAVNYLMSKKYTKTAAMAIVANLIMESGLRTNAVGDQGAAHGLAQWHSPRRNAIAKQFGKPVENMNFHEQLDAIDWEIRTNPGGASSKDLFNRLNSAKDLGEAVADMVDGYEKPADRAGNKVARTKIAMNVEKTMGGGSASGGASGGSSPASATPAKAAAPTPHPLAKPLADHTEAVRANTAALQAASSGNPAPSGGNNNAAIHAPVNVNASQPSWLSLQLSKIGISTGE